MTKLYLNMKRNRANCNEIGHYNSNRNVVNENNTFDDDADDANYIGNIIDEKTDNKTIANNTDNATIVN